MLGRGRRNKRKGEIDKLVITAWGASYGSDVCYYTRGYRFNK